MSRFLPLFFAAAISGYAAVCQPSGQERSVWCDTDGSLRLSLHEDAYTAVYNGSAYVAQAADGVLIRNSYDGLSRLTQRLVWDTASESVKPHTVFSYRYKAGSSVPVSSTELRYIDGRRIETLYDSDANPYEIRTYAFADADGAAESENAATETARHGKLLSEVFLSYRKDSRLAGRTEVVYDGNTERRSEDIYEYTGSASFPDTERYENGELKLKRTYTADDAYTETIYFDGEISVSVSYADGFKIEEIYRAGDREMGRRRFAGTDGSKIREFADETVP